MQDTNKNLIETLEKLINKVNNLILALQETHMKNRWQKIPEASITLNIGRKRLRTLCEEGVIPCKVVNPNSKRVQFLVDVVSAADAISNYDINQYKK